MKNHGITFGTDGWRAIIADGFTTEKVGIVAQAFAEWLRRSAKPRGRVLIGYDSRFGGELFSLAAARVLAGNGFRVDVTDGPVPTPAVSWRIPMKGYLAGLMVTASHNPSRYSGIKVKPFFGGSPDESVIGPIVKRLGKTPPRMGPESSVKRVNFRDGYLRAVGRFVDLKAVKRLKGSVVGDAMGGPQAGNLSRILKGGTLKVKEIHGAFDPMFFGLHSPEPIEMNLGELKKEVVKSRAVLGMATDGDGDRLGIVSNEGKFLTPHVIFALSMLFMVRVRRQSGEVIKTVSGSFLINRIARAHNLKLHETPVGFKYLCALMRTRDILIGGEESGGLGFKGYIPERDGLAAGLLVLEMLSKTGKSLSALVKELGREFGESHYKRVDARHPQARQALAEMKAKPPGTLAGMRVASVNQMDGLKLILEDDSWLLFRASGTEPLLRIYAESGSDRKTGVLIGAGAKIAGLKEKLGSQRGLKALAP